jgi:phosphoglucosamine mutase
LQDIIKNVEDELGNQGRVLVRYSGTQPMLRVMVEGPTKEITTECVQKIVTVAKTELT